MIVKHFEVSDLLGRRNFLLSSDFNRDLNIITGRNGAGKTSLLKLLWYVISGNITIALQEIPFAKCRVVTDVYECTVYRLSRSTCRVEIIEDGEEYLFDDMTDDEDNVVLDAEEQAKQFLVDKGGSVFFSTFRRIEGGFTLSSKRNRVTSLEVNFAGNTRVRNDIDEAFAALSRRLSNGRHLFVSAISTSDIDNLLLRRFTDFSAEYNDVQKNVSDGIISTIKEYKSDIKSVDTAERLLDEIRVRIENMEVKREIIMKPIAAVQIIIERLIRHTGINIGSRLSFGDAANAVNSELLSAGEKQMLSFICYNAFYRDTIILIDEPELSLHPDWQRQLFPILLSQNSSNQFIIATHSPFIYGKYPDKEISINLDRGDSEGAQ